VGLGGSFLQEEQEEMQVRTRAPSASSRVIGLRVMSVCIEFCKSCRGRCLHLSEGDRFICLGAASYSLSCGGRVFGLFMFVPCLGWKIDDAHACLLDSRGRRNSPPAPVTKSTI